MPIFPLFKSFFKPAIKKRGEAGEGKLYDEVTRTMFPLKLSYAWTVHKSHGQTICNKILIDKKGHFHTHSSLYVAMLRATCISDIGFPDGVVESRLMGVLNESMQERKDFERRTLDVQLKETYQSMYEHLHNNLDGCIHNKNHAISANQINREFLYWWDQYMIPYVQS